jgi:transposase
LAIRSKTALLNEIRGTLAEFGVVCKTLGTACTRNTLMSTIHDSNGVFPAPLPELLQLLAERLDSLDAEIARLDEIMNVHAKSSEMVKRLMAVEGIGIITASAMVCSAAEPNMFKSARNFAAYIGLTPRQHSSGGKDRLGSITKRGDSYLRTLLIQGAKNVIRRCIDKSDELSLWIQSLLLRRHSNVVAVALANKMARVVWAMLTKGESYRVPRMIAVESC